MQLNFLRLINKSIRVKSLVWRNQLFFSLGLGCLAFSSYGKYGNVDLPFLVGDAELVAYGEIAVPSRGAGGSDALAKDSNVLFVPNEIFKGPSRLGQQIVLCNTPENVESYDLRKIPPGKIIIFTAKVADCYMPIAGIAGVVMVSGGLAQTLIIQGEPEEQSLDGFRKKIRRQVKELNSTNK